jgi:hypothetical protein
LSLRNNHKNLPCQKTIQLTTKKVLLVEHSQNSCP